MCLLKYRCVLVVVLLVQQLTNVTAQHNRAYNLYLKSGTIVPLPTLELPALQPGGTFRLAGSDEIKFVIIQFFNIPDEAAVRQLNSAGITLLDYIPENAYTATVHGQPDRNALQLAGARAVVELEPEQKIHPALLGPDLPAHALREAGKIDVRISYIKDLAPNDLLNGLDSLRARLLSDDLSAYQVIEARVPIEELPAVAGLPWVQYIEAVPPPEELLNDKSEAATRASVLTSALPGQRQLNGEGVVIGIGDSGNLLEHIDISTRLLSYDLEASYWHGVHVAGTAAGGGIMNEKYKGYAPKASIVKRATSEIWKQASTLVRDFGMIVTNNSYGGSVCPDYGAYTVDSYILDRQASDLPNLQHVFAAGNSGLEAPCEGVTAGFGNIIGGSISAKNVISTGRTGATGLIALTSSKGPTQDGRIKPEIIAPGTSITSTLPGNTYQGASGTSMAAPAVVGGLALLYQRYKQLNGGNNPKNMLMKALLCNGATDKGLAGPDFNYGFGVMNLLRSVSMLEKGQYFNGRLAHQAKDGFEISVPPNTALVKIMLYWNDAAPALLTGKKSLVNDLDLKVVRLGNAEVLPSFPRAAQPLAAAAAGVDTVNNIEQIVVESPAAGTYIVNVSGTKVPSGPQEYFLVYDMIETSAILAFPAGGEHFTKGDVVDISWDSYGNSASTFSVSYTMNDGVSWTNLNPAVAAGTNQLSWTVPDATTTTAKVRIVQNSTGVVKESAAFAVMGVPVISLSTNQCESYAAVQWTAVSGATDYEVMRLQGNEMRPVAVTSELKYVLSSLSRDSTYYISVRPRNNGVPGRRAVAISRKPDSGTCQGVISDGDLAVDAIVSPSKSGRLLTSISLGEFQEVKVRLRNLDDQPVIQSFQMGYAVGNAAMHWETVNTDIEANNYLVYTFLAPIDMRNAGAYPLTVLVKLEGDQVAANNQQSVVIRQLANAPVSLPFADDLESLQNVEINANTMGAGGGERYDFSQERDLGRLRTAAGLAYSGTKGFTVDANNQTNLEYPTYLDATFNLARYHADRDEIRLSFRYRLYATPSPAWPLHVYVRAKDTDPWIPALESSIVPYFTKNNKYWLMSVEISDLLKRNGKDFSTSFQVRWEQSFRYPTQTDGSTIDDIRLYTTTSDLEVTRVNALAIPSCDANGFQEYSVLIKNNGTEDCYRVPFDALINDELAHQGYVPVVRAGADTLFSFSFSSTQYLSSDRNVKVAVKKAFDLNAGNDFSATLARAAQVISGFPYLEDFENGQGGWYLTEPGPLWTFGTPNTGKVVEAASGHHAWATNLSGNRGSDVVSYLYSPCFAMNGMVQPSLSFSASIDLAACAGGSCDVAYVEYNVSGNTWMRLGGVNSGTNWYNANQESADVWNVQDYTRWHVVTVPIPKYFPGGYVRFRFVIRSKSAAGRAGIAIDDIHIYDSLAMVYTNAAPDNPTVFADVQGSDWVSFRLYNSVVAAINPHGQSLGQVSVKAFLDNGITRIANKQYYLGRSFTISASNPDFTQPVDVRLYITDEECERLIAVSGKAGTVKPGSAYELAVSKYSGSNEDGNLENNGNTAWTFYAKSAVRKVPYAQGYYLEFTTKGFSEFWFAKDFLGSGTPLPVRLASFSATPVENATLLEWRTAGEENVSHFEIERSADARAWASLPGEIPAIGEGGHIYKVTDASPLAGVNYYRLKMVDYAAGTPDRTFAYSHIVSVDFAATGNSPVVLFPNPATDKLYIRSGNRRFSKVELHAASGTQVYTSAENQSVVDVAKLVSGMHWVTIDYADGSRSSHKIVIVH
ncbi:S8 family serine peptidase [Dyadobacter endophyticus]|uniref:S8 family serine peptidase n=1 Tax=Dyadobacter endophyticus TaxID=1749036 RepID=UPI003CECA155